MKLVMVTNYSDGCTFESESYLVFEGESVFDGEARLGCVQQTNKRLDEEHRIAQNKYTRELTKFVDNKLYNKGKTPPVRPELVLVKFCGIECFPNSNEQSHHIITLAEWIEQHTA